MVRSLYLLIFLCPLLLLGACKDVPRYTIDDVIEAARKYSPECMPRVSGWGCPTPSQYEEVEPVFVAEYVGDGEWIVVKTCPINSEWNGYWYFYEDTGGMKWNFDYVDTIGELDTNDEIDE